RPARCTNARPSRGIRWHMRGPDRALYLWGLLPGSNPVAHPESRSGENLMLQWTKATATRRSPWGSRAAGQQAGSNAAVRAAGRVRRTLAALAALLALCLGQGAFAQSPQVTQGVPAEAFLGEGLCFDTTVSNSGAPGFGPYLRLVLPAGLDFASAEIFDSAANV